jgi:hypothetical protein
MKKLFSILLYAVAVAVIASSAGAQKAEQQTKPAPNPAGPSAHDSGREYSGMYSFLKDGEFVQITVEDEGKVSGFVSRYGDGENDKGEFVDQYFKSAKLESNKLNFTTQTVRAVWFDFNGTVERGDGKNPGDEAYYVLKGTLTENAEDAAKKVTSHLRDVVLKIFPAEASKN